MQFHGASPWASKSQTHAHTVTQTHTHTCTRTHIHTHVRVSPSLLSHFCVSIRAITTGVYTKVCVCVCVCECVCVCVCVCVWVCGLLSPVCLLLSVYDRV